MKVKPSKKKLATNLKPYVGRIFRLSRHEKMWVGTEPKDIYGDIKREVKREDYFGECVFVIDESLKKVRVADKNNHYHWISKNYVRGEIKTSSTETQDHLYEAMNNLIEIQKIINEGNSFAPQDDILAKSKEAIVNIRKYLDTKENS